MKTRVGRRKSPGRVHRTPPEGVTPQIAHLIARDRADEVLALGLGEPWFRDLYHFALRVSWSRFLLGVVVLYGAANAFFAVIYMLPGDAIANAQPSSFADAFFFSIQTMATVGYGQMWPQTLYANIVVTVESAVGLMFLAVVTGLVFARFSRPTARILFSRVAVIAPYDGVPTLTVRLANQRRNQILQAEVDLALLRDELTEEGEMIRRFYDLELARRRSPVFALTFTVMHRIDEESPLYGTTASSLQTQNAELVVTASGIDETIAQRVHARISYLSDEILWDHRFADLFGWTEDGRRVIDYRRFHDTIPLSAARHAR
ncbi:MAG: ATP-sensitive inward rectifier potassium channel 10 [Alphaproteobacteria bacterium]|nr:ATP-sensitive inward rectifier potassium channel 10 [Alphaproteobacteria bacterium]MBV9153710.1 ATP-sensitive inward rectifier potassium channel 10 [Alphaproteobacteria bacterium]